MNQQKTGAFLKALRKQKGLTQEQLAEIMYVSNRTVSRWENGHNMPDIDILIQLSDYFEIDLRELLDGERKSENTDNNLKETVLKAVDYSNIETERYIKRIHRFLSAGAILWFISQIISHTKLMEVYIFNAISNFAEGAACGMILLGLIVTSRYGLRIKAFKQRLLSKQQQN